MTVATTHGNTADWALAMEQLSQDHPEPNLDMLPAELVKSATNMFRNLWKAVRAGYCGMDINLSNLKAQRYEDVLMKCFRANGLQVQQAFTPRDAAVANLRPVAEQIRKLGRGFYDELYEHIETQEGWPIIRITWSKSQGPMHACLFFFRDASEGGPYVINCRMVAVDLS